MRCIAVVLIVCSVTITALAQVGAPTIAPAFYGFRNSVIDHNGRVLVFDSSYTYPAIRAGVDAMPVRFPPTVTTRLTVIESNAAIKNDAQYEGTFQVVGVGRYAVYAIITTYPSIAASPLAPVSVSRQLVAIGPSSFPTLPSIDIPLQSDVKVSAVGDDGEPDTIAVVDNVVTPLLGVATGTVQPLPPPPVQARIVQIYRSKGDSFNGPAIVPLP
jgi:hypothetical protein